MNGPIAITSRNGLEAVRRAYQEMLSGTDELDAAVAGVNLVELDPNERTVGSVACRTWKASWGWTLRSCTGPPAGRAHRRE